MTRIERWVCYGAILLPFLVLIWLPTLERGFLPPPAFELTDAKLSLEIDRNQKSVNPNSIFPAGTKRVYCWFSWRNGKPGAKIVSRWNYLDQNLHILDIPAALTRNSGEGIVSLVMPKGKALPPGSYSVEFERQGKIIKSIRFVVLPIQSPSTNPKA